MHPGVAKDALVQVSDALCFQVLRLGLQHFSPATGPEEGQASRGGPPRAVPKQEAGRELGTEAWQAPGTQLEYLEGGAYLSTGRGFGHREGPEERRPA